MALEFRAVTENDIEELARVAHEIWHGYWPPIIGQAQTDYMVNTLQSVPALKKAILEDGYQYWLLVDEDGIAGYTGCDIERMTGDETHDKPFHHSPVVDATWKHRLFISKIYLYPRARGKHYASRVIEFYEQLCQNENLPVMYLMVNRRNELGLRAYKGRGFQIMEETEADIGEGFYMIDYIMAKEVTQASA